jgi:hypothetical protein
MFMGLALEKLVLKDDRPDLPAFYSYNHTLISYKGFSCLQYTGTTAVSFSNIQSSTIMFATNLKHRSLPRNYSVHASTLTGAWIDPGVGGILKWRRLSLGTLVNAQCKNDSVISSIRMRFSSCERRISLVMPFSTYPEHM